MEEKRKRRYLQKTAELEDRVDFLEANLGTKENFLANRVLRKAMYKEYQEAVEILSDLAAMMVKDSKKLVEDDYTNLERACTILRKEHIEEQMKKANGLRNVLIHEYNSIIDELAYDSMVELLPLISEFNEGVKKWTERK